MMHVVKYLSTCAPLDSSTQCLKPGQMLKPTQLTAPWR
jgi:hypothetical protein